MNYENSGVSIRVPKTSTELDILQRNKLYELRELKGQH